MGRRHDVRRSVVALLAALVAGIGTYSAIARLQVIPAADTAVLLLGAETAVGLGLALWPGPVWSRRRAVALSVCVLGLLLMLPGPLISAILVPGCACPGDARMASLLDIGHQYWMIAGMVGFPLLIGIAAFIPSASRHVEMPREPGASSETRPE